MAKGTRTRSVASRGAARAYSPTPLPSEVRKLPSLMTETNGGSSVERVPGFDMMRAMTAGFPSSRVSGPTFLMSAPDAGYFSAPPSTLLSQVPPPGSFPATGKPENVIGFDDRVMVNDTALIPWRCICHLEITYDSGAAGVGTGWFAGPRTVITAGHCLYDRTGRRHARQVRVIPGRNGTVAPYGYVVSNDVKLCPGWVEAKTDEEAAGFDYGAIVIRRDQTVEDVPFGERIGFFGLRRFEEDDEDQLQLLMVNNAGYPYEPDKPYGTLWFNAGRVHLNGQEGQQIDSRFLEYMIDTEGGQSGSPVFIFDAKENQRYVVAIHTTGNFINRGLRITREVFNTIRDWTER